MSLCDGDRKSDDGVGHVTVDKTQVIKSVFRAVTFGRSEPNDAPSCQFFGAIVKNYPFERVRRAIFLALLKR
jgi:hypothetical protein